MLIHSVLQYTVYGAYEKVKKRTFLPMLILVGLFLPLLLGLILLYPWIGDRSKKKEPKEKQDEEEENELLPVNSLKHTSDSEE